MGIENRVTCRNKECRYSVETREGAGFILFREQKRVEEDIKNGIIKNEKALECVQNGDSIASVATYLCPKCKEFVTDNQIYFVRYNDRDKSEKIFPFGLPNCRKCGTELIFIDNIRSSKVKCPKCGGELRARISAYYD